MHQAYGTLTNPTYLIDANGYVAYYNIWAYAPTLYKAIEALLAQGCQGVVNGGIDHAPHLMPALFGGWRGIRRGMPQSMIDLALAAPGLGLLLWLGDRLSPLVAPFVLRE